MELILEKELDHQKKAVDAVANVLEGVYISEPSISYQNPTFNVHDIVIQNNLNVIKQNIREDYRYNANSNPVDYLNIDVKMETGTGKTYVYTQTIFELHKRYGFNKFIIAVPSLSIKAGTRQFIDDPYVRHHFADACGYNCNIELCVLESPKRKKKKAFLPMPFAVRDYVTGSCQNTNRIFVLLLNMQLLTSGSMLSRSDYDYLVEGFEKPFDALSATKPVVIIDEPHRFSRKQMAFKRIVDELKPQMILRYGSTFPDHKIVKGKENRIVKDFNNLVYELDACDAFNQNLIKGIAKEHLQSLSEKPEKVKITSIVPKTSVKFQFRRAKEKTKTYILSEGDSLSVISTEFDGIIINAIGKNYIELSNGQTKYQGEELNTDIYSSSYQEQMLKLAIQRHFETERQNFSGRQFKIKTLALFFIDDITSYRNAKSEKKPYLRETFERLLEEKLRELIVSLPPAEDEYKAFLEASLADISGCHAGYFSQDNSDTDEEIAKEVDEILRNKKGLLAIKRSDGSYNIRRFLFSKWTLKEGWDNPNVFTITKLRSSGSENSKLQEVGRGLRLPVDENGNRISNQEFQLNYIVDFSEADFAKKLVEEINGDRPKTLSIDADMLQRVAKARGLDANTLFGNLFSKQYIDFQMKINAEKRETFFAEYPEFTSGIRSGKITDRNNTERKKIKIRKAVYSELKELWEAINRKYYLFYDADIEREIPGVLHSILREKDTFAKSTVQSLRDEVITNDNGTMGLQGGTGVSYTVNRSLPYNEFLKRISIQTSLPIVDIHNAIVELSKEKDISEALINEHTVAQIVLKFKDWKIRNTQTRFRYSKSNQKVSETALSYKDGAPRELIKQGVVGTMFVPGTPSKKYLYDTITFDSPLEKENIMTDISEVVVYGKIPKASISIPTIVGETYSPDFMYVVKKTDGSKELNIIVETKLVEGQSALRGKEEAKIKCAELFFNQLTLDGYEVSFHKQLSNKKVKQIIEEVVNS